MFNMDSAEPGIATILDGITPVATFPYPEGEWFNVKHHLDLDGGTMELFINDTSVHVNTTYFNTIGSINFYSIDANNRYYIDDMEFDLDEGDPTNVLTNHLQTIQLFPNPTSATLNINLGNIVSEKIEWTLFNLLGKQLGSDTFTGNGMETIDVSHLPAGLYLLSLRDKHEERIFRVVVE